ncbi:uncharacterized protein JCM10292_000668 [Rhodotorula paludigena]|uniref:uncharacterized protein n=1 Tax=Rhodotorula paludigena TaxID=86838 RepID=UPI0031742811
MAIPSLASFAVGKEFPDWEEGECFVIALWRYGRQDYPGAGRKGTRLACSYPAFVEDDPKVPSCAGPCTFFVEITPNADKPRQVVTQACLEHNHDFHLRAYCREFLKENEEPSIAERSSLIQEYALSSRLPALKKKFDGYVPTQATLTDVQPLLDAQEQTFRDIRAYLGADAEKAVKGSAMQKRIFLDKGELIPPTASSSNRTRSGKIRENSSGANVSASAGSQKRVRSESVPIANDAAPSPSAGQKKMRTSAGAPTTPMAPKTNVAKQSKKGKMAEAEVESEDPDDESTTGEVKPVTSRSPFAVSPPAQEELPSFESFLCSLAPDFHFHTYAPRFYSLDLSNEQQLREIAAIGPDMKISHRNVLARKLKERFA